VSDIASLNRNQIRSDVVLVEQGREIIMMLHDVTEQKITINFVLPSKKTQMQTFNVLEKAENMSKDSRAYT
jgi:hypothetical protein